MKFLKFLFIGIIFGITLTKAEIVSWYRWQEMFRMDGFHLYGIMLVSFIIGASALYIFRRYHLKGHYGEVMKYPSKNVSLPRYSFGGLIFGVGFAMAGCPGAAYTLIGHGSIAIFVVLLSALTGTYFYGLLRDKLPH